MRASEETRGSRPEDETTVVSDSGGPSPESAASRHSRTFAAGEKVAGRYRIVRFIAEGGMGEVYEAEDLELQTRVALKTIRAGTGDRGALDRFKREIQLARKVSHPNVCRIFDLGYHRDAGKPEVMFLTMELLDGETLAERVQRTGAMTTAEALPIVRQMVAGLEAAHVEGIVHRDFKSGNVILVSRDLARSGSGSVPPASAPAANVRAVIVDFGLARAIETSESMAVTHTGGIVGTPAYMAPEQLEGQQVSPATDLYALGVVMYNMVTGQMPFSGSSPFEAALKRLKESPSSPRVHAANLDLKWEAAILRCLERDPADRFASAADVLRQLEGEKVEGGRKQKRRRQRLALGGLAALLVLVAAVATYRRVAAERTTSAPSAPAVAATPGLPAPPKALRRSIAVLGFKNLSGHDDLAWLSTALAEMLGSELAAGEKLRVLSGEDVARMKTDLSLAESATLARDTLARIRAHSHSDYVVLGSYLATGAPGNAKIRLDLRLQETGGDGTATAVIGTGTEAELSDLVTATAAKLRDKLEVGNVLPAEARAIQAALPSRAEAIRHYSAGIDLLRSFDATGAREQLERAVAAEPSYALAHAALASAWSALGYDERATAAAKKAFDLSPQLPREERLVIQGNYYEAAKAWDKAIETYRILWTFAPDNPDYGLRLAAMQTAGGHAGEALAVVAALRKLPAPLGSDARIDLAEAAAAFEVGDLKRAVDAARRGAERARQRGLNLVVAQTRLVESEALQALGEMSPSKTAAEEAQRTYAALGDKRGIAESIAKVASLLENDGDLDASKALHQRSLSLHRETGNRRGVAQSLQNVGRILYQQGDLGGARNHFEQALEIRQAIGDRRGMAASLNNIGAVTYDQGDFATARRVHGEALAIRRAIGDRQGIAISLNNIANVLSDEGDLAGSLRMYEESLALRRQMGEKQGIATTLSNMGNVVYDLGDFARARKLIEESLQIKQEIGYKRGVSLGLTGLSRVLYYQGDLAGAKKRAQEAAALAREMGDQSSLAVALVYLGATLEAEDDLAGAHKLYEEAIAIQNALGEKLHVAQHRLELARLSIVHGKPRDAVATARRAASFFASEKNAELEAVARASLAEALLVAGDVAGARREIARAEALTANSQHTYRRSDIAVISARVAAADAAGHAAAVRALEASLARATQKGWIAQALEIRLAIGEVEQRTNPAAARARLLALERDARARGFRLLARRAAALAA